MFLSFVTLCHFATACHKIMHYPTSFVGSSEKHISGHPDGRAALRRQSSRSLHSSTASFSLCLADQTIVSNGCCFCGPLFHFSQCLLPAIAGSKEISSWGRLCFAQLLSNTFTPSVYTHMQSCSNQLLHQQVLTPTSPVLICLEQSLHIRFVPKTTSPLTTKRLAPTAFALYTH